MPPVVPASIEPLTKIGLEYLYLGIVDKDL